jgi:hypothetical protein
MSVAVRLASRAGGVSSMQNRRPAALAEPPGHQDINVHSDTTVLQRTMLSKTRKQFYHP